MSPHMPRWIFSSMVEHFRTVAEGIPLPYFVEGVDEEQATDFQRDSSLFRMDGPIVFQSSNTEFYRVEFQILLTDLVATTNDNAYDIYVWAGIFQSSFLNDPLRIYKYGTGPDDDQSLIGCLEPDTSVKNNVRVASYGMIDKDWRVRQASVNGKFMLCPL